MPDMRDLLKQLITRYGTSVIEDPPRFASLLNDLRKGEYKREANLLITGLREGVPQHLLSASQGEPVSMLVGRLATRLVEEAGLADEAARWAVESWALALGMEVVAPEPPVDDAPPTEAELAAAVDGDHSGPPEPVRTTPVRPAPTDPVVAPSLAPAVPPVELPPTALSDQRFATAPETGSRLGSFLAEGGWLVMALAALALVISVTMAPATSVRTSEPDQGSTAPSLVQVPVAASAATESPAEAPAATWPPPPGSAVGDTLVNPIDGAEMVWVPEGEFIMGSVNGSRDERPIHRVYLSGFRIYKTDVTVAQYRLFCGATGAAMPTPPDWGRQDAHPIVNVTWHDAKAYATWAGVALPTEAQWEKAARGTDGREFPWGNAWDAAKCVCNVGPAPARSTAPVGSKPSGASPYGCLDMAGNVWEWCADWYGEHCYSQGQSRNPTGPPTGENRVLRGGAWYAGNAGGFRVHYRYGLKPGHWLQHCVGFRCVSREGSS